MVSAANPSASAIATAARTIRPRCALSSSAAGRRPWLLTGRAATTVPTPGTARTSPSCPSAAGKAANIFTARANTEARAAFHFAAEHLSYDRRDPAAHKRIVAERFAGEGWEVPRLLKEMDAAQEFFFDSNAQVEMDTWSAGRIVLLGDAGYCAAPTSGRGTSQALIGAYLLAGELATHNADHPTAFAAYEHQMRPYTAEHQALGREAAARFFLPAPTQEVLDTLAANTPETPRTDPIRLPDYTPTTT